jgi:pimeloyl-ACP methyl ester carboxylesterase
MKMPFSAPGYANEDLVALGRDFRVPIFVLQGTADDIAPASLAKAYVDSLVAPRTEYVPVEGAGHYAFMTRSEFVLQELVAWEHQLESASADLPP